MAAFGARADWYRGGYQLDWFVVMLLLATGVTVGVSWWAAPLMWENRLGAALVTTLSVACIAGYIGVAVNS